MEILRKILKKIFKGEGIKFIVVQNIKNTYVIITESKEVSIEMKS